MWLLFCSGPTSLNAKQQIGAGWESAASLGEKCIEKTFSRQTSTHTQTNSYSVVIKPQLALGYQITAVG